jgi:arginyl-tRNA synthetase
MKKAIATMILEGIQKLQHDGVWSDCAVEEVPVERPKDPAFGDWTSSIAFVVSKELKKAPYDIAQELASAIGEMHDDIQVSAVAPGYINIVLSRSMITTSLRDIEKGQDAYGKTDFLRGKKIMIEYTQPNPFKPFHIGHLMSNAIGESLSRILSFTGADVVRANYQGDVGPHVAKALWAIQKFGYDITKIDEIGTAYAKGHEAYEENDTAKKEIQAINRAVYKNEGDALMRSYMIGRERTLERFEEIYKMLGTKFDLYFFESEAWRIGEEIVRQNIGTVFEESDGAVIFDGEKYGLHKRVFITSERLPTYEAKEIGLAMLKKERSPSDIYIVTTAVEQEEYFKVVKKAIELIDASFKGRIQHISHGMMQLISGKMSSRKGNVITGETLISDARMVAAQKMSDRSIGDAQDLTINAVAVAGIKFSILKQSVGKNIVYDPESALSFDGDSGPYIQYTHARCRSVIAKAQDNGILGDFCAAHDEAAVVLERLLLQFPEVVCSAGNIYAPHMIANHLIACAREFNTYYAQNMIVDKQNAALSSYRVALSSAVAVVLKNGLSLLGIEAPEKM